MDCQTPEIIFHHTVPIQLRFNDADQFGHVNNTVYFSFYDLGKTGYMTSVLPDAINSQTGIVLAHVEADFINQIHISDSIAVQTAIKETGTKSFKFIQRVIDLGTGEIKCTGESTMVVFDLETRETKALDPKWIEAICQFEGRDVRKKR